MVVLLNDNILRIYDNFKDLKPIKTLFGYTDTIKFVIKLENGNLASIGRDRKIILWDKNKSYSIKKIIEDNYEISSFTQTNAGMIITGYNDGSIKFWESFVEKKSLSNHSAGVTSLTELNDGFIITGSRDKTIIIWNLNDNYSVFKKLTGHDLSITSVIKLENGMIASSSDDGNIIIWNQKDNFSIYKTLKNHEKPVKNLINLNLDLMASASEDSFFYVWNSKTFSFINQIETGDSLITKLYCLNNGLLATGHYDGSIKIWNINFNFAQISKERASSSPLSSIIQLKNGKLVAGFLDGVIHVYDPLNNFNLIYTLKEHSDAVLTLLEVDNGKMLSGSKDNLIKIWDPYNEFSLVDILNGHSAGINNAIQISSGQLITASDDNLIKIWSLKPRNIQSGHEEEITDLELFSNTKLISSSCDKKINIHNLLGSHKLIKTVTGHTSSVNKILIYDKNTLISASRDTNIKIWDVTDNYNLKKTLIGHTKSVDQILKLSNGFLMSGGNLTRVKLWDTKDDFSLLQTLEHKAISFFEIEQDKIFSINQDGNIKIFTKTNAKHFYKYQDNIFTLNDYINSQSQGGSIIFNSLSLCNSKIFIDSQEVKIKKNYDFNSSFLYKGYCETNYDEIAFGFYESKSLTREVIVTIFFENTPHLWQPITIIGETMKTYEIDLTDKIYDDKFGVNDLLIEFVSLPLHGNIVFEEVEEETEINIPYKYLIFEYINASNSELNIIDNFEFRIINGYGLKSQIYKVEINLSSHKSVWEKPYIIIFLICIFILCIFLVFGGVHYCRKKKCCFIKSKEINISHIQNSILY